MGDHSRYRRSHLLISSHANNKNLESINAPEGGGGGSNINLLAKEKDIDEVLFFIYISTLKV